MTASGRNRTWLSKDRCQAALTDERAGREPQICGLFALPTDFQPAPDRHEVR